MLACPVGRCLGTNGGVGRQRLVGLGRRRRADGLDRDPGHPRHDREAEQDLHPSSLGASPLEHREEVPKKTLSFAGPP